MTGPQAFSEYSYARAQPADDVNGLLIDRDFNFREYVYRCYALCANDMDKDRVDIILKGKVIRAATDGVLQTKDWSKEPLPEYIYLLSTR